MESSPPQTADQRTVQITVNASSDANTSANAIDATDATWPPKDGWFTFPPFPKPPPGVEIVLFKDFKPLGIHILPEPDANSDDEDKPSLPGERVERDALGVPTVTLRVHHDNTGMGKKKRKARTKMGANGQPVRVMWFEEWAEIENSRRLSGPIDPSLPRIDRLHIVATEFKGAYDIQLNQDILNLWDRFRHFTGLISSITPPAARKKGLPNVADPGDDGDDDDELPEVSSPKERTITVVDGDQASGSAPTRIPSNERFPPSPLTDEQREQRREYYREVRDTRKDRFLNDPESCTKIFFSGFYRDRGMIFSEKMCRDGPMLLGFFLRFVLRHRVFPEIERDLKKAAAVVETARKELPHTFVVSKAIPDGFSRGCELLFGTATHTTWWVHGEDDDSNDSEDEAGPEAKRQKLDDEAAAVLQAAAGSDKIEVITPDAVMSMEQDLEDLVANADVNGEQEANDAPAAPEGEPEKPVWGLPAAPVDWGAPSKAEDWGTGPTENPLTHYLGPTTLPLTHTTGIVERSTRRIKSVVLPPAAPTQKRKKSKQPVGPAPAPDAAGVERELEAAFAKMTLAPWPEWDLYDKADVQKPRLLPSSRGAAVSDDAEGAEVTSGPAGYSLGPGERPHDPFKDEITVLVEPSVVDKLWVGMGIDATWVQLARMDPDVPVEVDPETFNNAYLQRKKKQLGGPGVPVAPTKIWYMEQVSVVHPSFHTEMVPLPTTEDVFGEGA